MSDVEIFRGHDGVFKRTGTCCRCGECCKGNPFEDDDSEYCPLFSWIAEGVGNCTNRAHPYYLRGCNSFPSHPSQIADKPGCSYRFERLNGTAEL